MVFIAMFLATLKPVLNVVIIENYLKQKFEMFDNISIIFKNEKLLKLNI
jgi:hypothetical protein